MCSNTRSKTNPARLAMRIGMATVLLGTLATAAAAQVPSSAPPAMQRQMQLQSLADLDPTRAWRIDAFVDHDETALLVMPQDTAAEQMPVRLRPATAFEVRGRFDAAGALDRLRVLRPVNQGTVLHAATAGERTAALQQARFGSSAWSPVVVAARARAWGVLGTNATIADGATLTWQPAGGGYDRAVWEMRLTVTRNGQPVSYLVRFDAVDGTLLEMIKEGSAQ